MVTETTARQWVITAPATDPAKPPIEVGRVDTVEKSKTLTLRIGRLTVSVAADVAKDIADALVKASELATPPITPPAQ